MKKRKRKKDERRKKRRKEQEKGDEKKSLERFTLHLPRRQLQSPEFRLTLEIQ
jgi:hypothetical protein